jgi:hypothetical protein
MRRKGLGNMADTETSLERAEEKLDQAQTVLDAGRKVLQVAQEAQAAAKEASTGLRIVGLVSLALLASAAIAATVMLVSRRRN